MTKKILLMSPNDGETNQYIETGFKQNGCDVVQFDYRKEVIVDLEQFDNQRPDLILITKGETFTTNDVSNLRNHAPVAFWHFDTWYPHDGYIDVIKRADFYFSMVRGFVPDLRSQGVNAYWIPEAACPDHHFPIDCNADPSMGLYTTDVAFMGSLGLPIHEHGKRLEVLTTAAIHALAGHFKLNTYGDMYGQSIPNTVLRYHRGRATRGREHNKAVAGAKIILGNSAMPYHDMSQSARDYRVLAAGGFLLTNRVKGEDEFFKDRHDLAYYDGPDDCVQRILYYLDESGDGPNERRIIAEQGRANVLANHTFRHRCAEILELTDGFEGRKT